MSGNEKHAQSLKEYVKDAQNVGCLRRMPPPIELAYPLIFAVHPNSLGNTVRHF